MSSAPTHGTAEPAVSVVVPVYNEEECVAPLVDAVREALENGPAWELVLVDDGSRDQTAEIAESISREDPRVRIVRLARNYGQTQAMQAGFDQARGPVVVSMDGDLQNDPSDIPLLLAKLDEGYDLVAGYRKGRQDKLITRKIPSFFANRIIAGLTGVRIRDNGCSLKAYRRDLLRQMHLYSDMHRFLPALAAATAAARIAEVPVKHHPRRFGASKYGLSRIAKVLGDLLTIKMISTFRERPMAMFGLWAAGAGLIGVIFSIMTLVAIASFQLTKARAYVLPGTAMLWIATAAFLLMIGFIAEVALRQSREELAEPLENAHT